jgi:hypothetical protein
MVKTLFTMAADGPTRASMTLAFLALAAIAQPSVTTASARPTGTTMPARATVRILSGAKVHLGPSSKAMMIKASVRVEDGQRRPAYLIEFE